MADIVDFASAAVRRRDARDAFLIGCRYVAAEIDRKQRERAQERPAVEATTARGAEGANPSKPAPGTSRSRSRGRRAESLAVESLRLPFPEDALADREAHG